MDVTQQHIFHGQCVEYLVLHGYMMDMARNLENHDISIPYSAIIVPVCVMYLKGCQVNMFSESVQYE